VIINWGFGKNTGLGMLLSYEILSITGFSISETGTFGKRAGLKSMSLPVYSGKSPVVSVIG
jgi:hypothetical protein